MNLPIYNIKGKGFYFLDRKLNEYRSVKNPFDRIDFNKVDLKNLVVFEKWELIVKSIFVIVRVVGIGEEWKNYNKSDNNLRGLKLIKIENVRKV